MGALLNQPLFFSPAVSDAILWMCYDFFETTSLPTFYEWQIRYANILPYKNSTKFKKPEQIRILEIMDMNIHRFSGWKNEVQMATMESILAVPFSVQ